MVDMAVMATALNATLDEIKDLTVAMRHLSTAIHPFSHTVNILPNKINGDLHSLTPENIRQVKLKATR